MCNVGTGVVVRIPENVEHCGVCTRVVLQIHLALSNEIEPKCCNHRPQNSKPLKGT